MVLGDLGNILGPSNQGTGIGIGSTGLLRGL